MFPMQLWPRNKAKFIQIWDKLAYIKQGFNQEKLKDLRKSHFFTT